VLGGRVPVHLLEVVDGAVDGNAAGVAFEVHLKACTSAISY
jgi:hypothetical protein